MKLTPELPTVWRLFPRSGRSASVLPATFTPKFANATPDIGSRTRTIHCAPLHTIPTIKRNVFNHVASSFTQSRATRFPCNSSSRKLLKITNAVNVQTHFYLMAPILGLTASSPFSLNWPFDQLGFIRPLAHSTPSRFAKRGSTADTFSTSGLPGAPGCCCAIKLATSNHVRTQERFSGSSCGSHFTFLS